MPRPRTLFNTFWRNDFLGVQKEWQSAPLIGAFFYARLGIVSVFLNLHQFILMVHCSKICRSRANKHLLQLLLPTVKC